MPTAHRFLNFRAIGAPLLFGSGTGHQGRVPGLWSIRQGVVCAVCPVPQASRPKPVGTPWGNGHRIDPEMAPEMDPEKTATGFAQVLHYGTHLQRATHYPLSPAADLVPRRIAPETRSPPILAPVVGPLHRGPGHSVSVVGSPRASRRGSQSGSGSARSARRLGQPGNPAPGDGGETRGCARDAGDGTGDRASDRPPQCCLFYLWG